MRFLVPLSLLLIVLSASFLGAQELHSLNGWRFRSSEIAIVRGAETGKPFSVAAERGAVFGEQNGVFEAWAFPVKILSHFRISASLQDYPVPIDINDYAAQIEVNPDQTTITYSHAAFTIRQHMFSPRGQTAKGAGAIVVFEIESIRPLELTFRFTPEMLRMWPAANYGPADAEWVPQGTSGYYILHTNDPTLSGGIAIPGARPGTLAPYQERPKTYQAEFRLAFDPKTDTGKFYPLLMTVGNASACGAQLSDLNARVAELYRGTAEYYAHFFDHRLTVTTPDRRFDDALRWAEIAIDQAQVNFHEETGLVAGYYTSADSARPGYGWFFGRDTEWTLYAINGYGDFALSRRALEFLFRRQRADGKIMHEFSQSADLVDWKSLPYFYAAADSTPLLVMAVADYVRTSGDTEFLQAHWNAVKLAYAFTRTHDPDGDGIYNNSEGTGWVESWPPKMPNQEIYLAALDQQSAHAIAGLATIMHDDALAQSAAEKAQEIQAKIASEYFDAASAFYAFSHNADGTRDITATIYPSVAWWDGTLSLKKAATMLSRWASSEFSTDWGLRDVSDKASIYDPISYHQGTVWPLFTGWVSLAEYRAGQTISAESHLYQNLLLTWAQDLGGCTELLSGAFYQPLGRSSSHQTWSSAMVLSPALHGLLGIDWDALHHTLRLQPNLPPDWEHATVRNVPLGSAYVDLEFQREGARLRITATSSQPFSLCGRAETCNVSPAIKQTLDIALPAVEIGLPHEAPSPGAATGQIKAIGQDANSVTFEAQGGSVHQIPVRVNNKSVRITGGTIAENQMRLIFSQGAGYQRLTVRW